MTQTKFEKYIYKLAYDRTIMSGSEYAFLGEDIFISNVLPRSCAGVILKAGKYKNGVMIDD